MSGGRAHGEDREYQEHCRDVLLARDPGLVAYAGDGIDVPFDVGHTTITVDVALKDSDGSLVLVECKRHESSPPQALVYAFAGEVEDIREATGLEVVALFFVKKDAQQGALTTAEAKDIGVFVCAGEQPLPNYGICKMRFDVDRQRRIRAHEVHLHEAMRVSESLDVKVTRARDVAESAGVGAFSHSEVTRGPGTKTDENP